MAPAGHQARGPAPRHLLERLRRRPYPAGALPLQPLAELGMGRSQGPLRVQDQVVDGLPELLTHAPGRLEFRCRGATPPIQDEAPEPIPELVEHNSELRRRQPGRGNLDGHLDGAVPEVGRPRPVDEGGRVVPLLLVPLPLLDPPRMVPPIADREELQGPSFDLERGRRPVAGR